MKEGRLNVLIVDDDPKFLESMKRSLESKNCDVQCAADQEKALNLLVNQVFHIAFIDCILQSGQGISLIQDIRKTIGCSVETVMMSGVIPEKSLSNYIDMGISAFLSKPISEKEIEDSLKKIREKIIYGSQKNILMRLFSNSHTNMQKIKFLVNIKQAGDYEFFLYLNSLISSKESLSIQFKLNNKAHTIICSNSNIIDYENDDSTSFLNKLLTKKFITQQEAKQLKGKSYKECINSLLNECIISSSQITDIKYDMLLETLKDISPGMQIPFSIDFILENKQAPPILSHGKYADLVFLFLKQKFNNRLFSLFDEEVMKQSFVFSESEEPLLPEAKSFLSDLKSGMKLKGIYNKYINDKNSFCNYIIYILLKGKVQFSAESNHKLKHGHFYTRYQSLSNLISAAKNPEQFFKYLQGTPQVEQLSVDEIKDAYIHFMKHNHPDRISIDPPKDLLTLVENLITQVQKLYHISTDPGYKEKQERAKKEGSMQKELELSEHKKICERYLEESKYKEALELIDTIPQAVISEQVYWQLLYLWIYFKYKNIKIKQKKAHEYMKKIQARVRETEVSKEKLYYFILGLYHESKENYSQAKISFEKTKTLDPSFQPIYPALHRISLQLLKEKQKSSSSFTAVLIRHFKKSINKQKKAG